MSQRQPSNLNENMRLALRLARRGYGTTSPNPMVGAVLAKGGKVIGRGWHRRAGGPHAEIEALRDARQRGLSCRGAVLYVTLEPCCTHGRTPPCTEALIAAGIKRVVVGAVDPNPEHSGRGFKLLKRAGIEVVLLDPDQPLADECARLIEPFHHWMIHRTPFVTVKAAMTLDGKIATAGGESKWITAGPARVYGMKLRQGSDGILVGITTILQDDPSLTFRDGSKSKGNRPRPGWRRLVLDSMARTPLTAKVVNDEHSGATTIVVGKAAPRSRVAALATRVKVMTAPVTRVGHGRSGPPGRIDLRWLLRKLGREKVTSLLVEGGGEVNASFLLGGLAQRVAFFYAPKILGGRLSRKGVAGEGVKSIAEAIRLREIEWRKLGPDLLLTAKVAAS